MKKHWLIITLLVALAIRLPGMFQSLWYDEAFTATVAGLPWARLWQATAGDVHPPLWYAIERLVILALGNSEPMLRLPSMALGLANVWLTWQVTQAMGLPVNVGRITTLLMAVLPGQVWYSNEARMYQLVQFAALLATLGVYRRWWGLYGLGLAVGLWSHNLFVVFAALLLAVAIARESQSPGRPLVATGLAGLSYTPWLAALAGQVGDVGNSFWVLPLNPGTPLYVLHELLWRSTPAWAGVHGVFISMLLILAGGWFTLRARRWDILVLALGMWAVLGLISVGWRPVLIGRTLMPAAPFVAMMLAHGFAGRGRGPALALLSIPILVIATAGYWSGETGRADIHRFTEPVILTGGGDAVFHGNLASYMLMSYYLDSPHQYVWRQANDLSQSLTRETKNAMRLPEADISELQAEGYRRLWLYWSLNPTTSTAEYDYITAVLDTFRHKEVVTFQSNRLIDARLYLVDLGSISYGADRSSQQ